MKRLDVLKEKLLTETHHLISDEHELSNLHKYLSGYSQKEVPLPANDLSPSKTKIDGDMSDTDCMQKRNEDLNAILSKFRFTYKDDFSEDKSQLNLQSTLMDIQKEYLEYESQKAQSEQQPLDLDSLEEEFKNGLTKGDPQYQLQKQKKKKSEFINLLKQCQICSDSDLNYASRPFKLMKKLKDVRIMFERKSNNVEQQLKKSNMNKNKIIEDIKADRVIIRKTLPEMAKIYMNEIRIKNVNSERIAKSQQIRNSQINNFATAKANPVYGRSNMGKDYFFSDKFQVKNLSKTQQFQGLNKSTQPFNSINYSTIPFNNISENFLPKHNTNNLSPNVTSPTKNRTSNQTRFQDSSRSNTNQGRSTPKINQTQYLSPKTNSQPFSIKSPVLSISTSTPSLTFLGKIPPPIQQKPYQLVGNRKQELNLNLLEKQTSQQPASLSSLSKKTFETSEKLLPSPNKYQPIQAFGKLNTYESENQNNIFSEGVPLNSSEPQMSLEKMQYMLFLQNQIRNQDQKKSLQQQPFQPIATNNSQQSLTPNRMSIISERRRKSTQTNLLSQFLQQKNPNSILNRVPKEKGKQPTSGILANVYNFEDDAYFKQQQIYKFDQEKAQILMIRRNITTNNSQSSVKKNHKATREEILHNQKEDLLHDEYSSNDDSNASATEAQLDNCYDESIKLQKKIHNATKGDLQTKIKGLLRIENVSKQV